MQLSELVKEQKAALNPEILLLEVISDEVKSEEIFQFVEVFLPGWYISVEAHVASMKNVSQGNIIPPSLYKEVAEQIDNTFHNELPLHAKVCIWYSLCEKLHDKAHYLFSQPHLESHLKEIVKSFSEAAKKQDEQTPPINPELN